MSESLRVDETPETTLMCSRLEFETRQESGLGVLIAQGIQDFKTL
jgi:hypothetical protein